MQNGLQEWKLSFNVKNQSRTALTYWGNTRGTQSFLPLLGYTSHPFPTRNSRPRPKCFCIFCKHNLVTSFIGFKIHKSVHLQPQTSRSLWLFITWKFKPLFLRKQKFFNHSKFTISITRLVTIILNLQNKKVLILTNCS